MKLQELLDKEIDSIGDDHIGSNTEETPLKEGLRAERSLFYSTFALEDHVEGMTAFSEKRKPEWKNK